MGLADVPTLAELPVETAQELLVEASRLGRGEASSLSPGLRQDQKPRIVLLSRPGPGGRARVAQGAGRGWSGALRALPVPRPDQRAPEWLRLDVVESADSFMGKLLPGLQGVGYSEGLIVLPEELSHQGLLKGSSLRKGYRERLPQHEGAQQPAADARRPRYRVRLRSACWNQRETYPVYRGHRVLRPEQVTPERLLAASCAAGDHLLTMLQSGGRFIYEYHPGRDHRSSDYNLLRHAGACYSLCQLYEATQDERYREGARTALDYLLGAVRESPEGLVAGEGLPLFLVDAGAVKLGGNALSILALCEYARVSGQSLARERVLGLGWGLLAHQAEDGSFPVHKRDYASWEADDFVSGYYPGESILALMALHHCDARGPWLKAARRAAHFLIEVRDRDLPVARLAHDHWLMLALAELSRVDPSPVYRRHLLRLSEAICQAQLSDQEESDWNGGFYRPPRSGPTSIRLEGLGAAVRCLQGTDVRRARQAMDRAALFLMQLQIQPESAAFFPRPELCLGGVPRSLSDFELRIDYDQHFISGLLSLRALGAQGRTTSNL